MNAHQRRIDRRKPRIIFDLEALPLQWGDIKGVSVVGDYFDFITIRPQGERLSSTTNVLKEHPPGGPLSLSADFTGLEERIMELTEQVKAGHIDCHRQRAAEMFNVAYEDVTPEQRAAGKNANYLSWWKV